MTAERLERSRGTQAPGVKRARHGGASGPYRSVNEHRRLFARRKRGEIDRPTQVQAIASSVWESAKHGAVVSLVLSVVLLVFPWLGVPLTLVGFVGLGKASVDLLHAFWDGLDDAQRQELHRAAFDAGVNLNRLLANPGLG